MKTKVLFCSIWKRMEILMKHQQFKNHKVVNKQQLKSAADFLVMQLSWIFDVNYVNV